MTNIVKVMLWGEEIGRLAWDDRRKNSYFTYNPRFVGKAIDVSPLLAPDARRKRPETRLGLGRENISEVASFHSRFIAGRMGQPTL